MVLETLAPYTGDIAKIVVYFGVIPIALYIIIMLATKKLWENLSFSSNILFKIGSVILFYIIYVLLFSLIAVYL